MPISGRERIQPGPNSVEPVDVVIITAARAEDEAVRLVESGSLGNWQETPGPPNYGFTVWRNRYQCVGGGQISVALTRSFEMGGEGTSNAAARLVDAYKPRCLAMCGVCAGNPGGVRLGDVIIADRVWRYDVWEQINFSADGKPIFHADTTTYQLNAQWKQAWSASRTSWVEAGNARWANDVAVPLEPSLHAGSSILGVRFHPDFR